MNSRAIEVPVIDDDELTAEVIERGLRKAGVQVRIVAACDGRDGLDVLRGKVDRKIRRPYLILLDLNMPKMNGFEFLEEVRNDSALRDSIVFVLSTSDTDADRSRAYQELVAAYMVKSAIGPQFAKLALLLQQYTTTVTFPY
jgi:CheY-like chemotaxis protein